MVAADAFLGLPLVAFGLALHLLLSRSGPLGALGLLFAPGAMVLAQSALALPIPAARAGVKPGVPRIPVVAPLAAGPAREDPPSVSLSAILG